MIKVLVVDDHTMVRAGLRALLEAFDDLAFAGEAPDGEAALMAFDRCKPDVVLMDVVMPRMDGVAALKALRARDPNARVVMLSSFPGEDVVQQAIASGAMGFVLKNATAEELAHAIRRAYNGSRILSPEATDALVHAMRRDSAPGADLTAREREVLAHMARGLNNSEIADRLFLSVSTIKFHVSAILSKLGVTNRVEAVALALQHGLLRDSLPA